MAISSHHLAQEKQSQETNGMKINANVVESATCRDPAVLKLKIRAKKKRKIWLRCYICRVSASIRAP